MFNLPVFVGLHYHQNVIQVCVMDQFRKILANLSVGNAPHEVMCVVAPFGGNVHAVIEASTGVAALTQKHCAEKLIHLSNWCVELAHPGYVARMKQTPTSPTGRTQNFSPISRGQATFRVFGLHQS